MIRAHTRRVAPHVEQLFHYPVKGLAGVELAEAHVANGAGLPYDRCVAVSNGSTALPTDGSRPEPATLMGLARNPGLTRLRLEVGDAAGTPLTIAAPDGSSLQVHLDDPRLRAAELAAADARVQGWIPAGQVAPPRLVLSDVPLWQQADAALSIVNPATLDLLGKAWGTALDARRFRANVYVAGLEAWTELDLVGRRVRLGSAELEVLRPIQRGRGAAVDPDDGSTLLDVPALLDATVGHRFLGVYARVVRSGRVRRGDPLVDLRRAAPVGGDRRRSGPGRSADQPRPVRLEAVEHETQSVRSLWFEDPLGLAGTIRPGQHVRLHAVDAAGPFWRSYTVSGVEGPLVRVTVALEPGGRMSAYLDGTDRPRLVLTGPFGELTVDPAGDTPLLLLTAGIGITPTVALLRHLAGRSACPPVTVVHVARSGQVALWDEVRSLVDRLPGAGHRLSLHLTGEDAPRCEELGARRGRPGAEDIAREVGQLPGDDLVALVCGPDRFGADVRAALRVAGVPQEAIRQEAFYSPPPGDRPYTPPVSAGPFAVRFARSGGRASWEPASGSLLDLAESCGLSPPADCRLAACNICATAVLTGSTAYTTAPMVPPADGGVLICCAVPTSDVTVDL